MKSASAERAARLQLEEKMQRLDPQRNPRHVAIILDGNGRWAKQRGLSRSEGHREGGENLSRLLDAFIQLGVPAVSLYAFSTENWRRPRAEVQAIWKLLNEFFEERFKKCLELGVRVMASGDLSRIPARSRKKIESVVEKTRNFTSLTANFCVNYGSQAEIIHAAEAVLAERLRLLEAGDKKKARAPILTEEFERHLYTHPLPPVDLLVRPGGENRISNFLLWQLAYAEIYVTERLWPDFSAEDMADALLWFQSRERRFGGL